jgi:AMMECR1 domain-containing protein
MSLSAWKRRIFAKDKDDAALERVLGWIRTIAFEEDAFRLEAHGDRGVYHFPFPAMPAARPAPLAIAEDDPRVRFVVRALAERRGARAGRQVAEELGFRPILRLRALTVLERDAPHGPARPLRLGLEEDERRALLARARLGVERALAGDAEATAAARPPTTAPRLAHRAAVAVALWTRGRLRGSVVSPPRPLWRAVDLAAASVCRDGRFERLSLADLDDTVVQLAVVHMPTVPVSRREVESADAYHDKAIFLADGARFGLFLPEIFNLRRHRKMAALVLDLAREKAGVAYGDDASVEIGEVTDFVESADRTHALLLDGPVATLPDDDPHGFASAEWAGSARAAGDAACTWLAAIQGEDGSLPRFVRPGTGCAEGVDPVRAALTAQGLAAFGVVHRREAAVETARRAIAWLHRIRPSWEREPTEKLLTLCYLGKAAMALGDDAALERAAGDVLSCLDLGSGPLVLANAAALLRAGDARARTRSASIESDLLGRFLVGAGERAPMSLAEWAETAAAFPSTSRVARAVSEWLAAHQMRSGAFPDTTASDFAYSRGTGKIFEALAADPSSRETALRALAWLLTMQYRPDSLFFVPAEHRARVAGGLRHDYHDTDAWIDAAGHLLVGLARLEGAQV